MVVCWGAYYGAPNQPKLSEGGYCSLPSTLAKFFSDTISYYSSSSLIGGLVSVGSRFNSPSIIPLNEFKPPTTGAYFPLILTTNFFFFSLTIDKGVLNPSLISANENFYFQNLNSVIWHFKIGCFNSFYWVVSPKINKLPLKKLWGMSKS